MADANRRRLRPNRRLFYRLGYQQSGEPPGQGGPGSDRLMERQRVARETRAFLTTLEAALGIVLEDIEAARKICPTQGPPGSLDVVAYAARKRIKKMAPADLRSACLRVSSELTAPFLRLEHEIDDYSAQCIEEQHQGEHRGLHDPLDRITKQVASLCEKADDEIKRCNEVLRETGVQT
jgi:hypothetical protein